MNVAILIPGFSDSERDWCIPVYLNLVKELTSPPGPLSEFREGESYSQVNVSVFAMRYPPRRDVYRVYGATVYAIGGRHDISGVGRLQLWARTLQTIWQAHQKKPFDVIHAIWADETGFVATVAGRWLHVPTVVSIAGGELVGLQDIGYGLQVSRFSRWVVRRALRGADRVIAPCQYAADLAKEWVRPDRLVVSPLGVDEGLFSPHPPTPSTNGRGGVGNTSSSPLPTGAGPGVRAKLLSVGSLIPVKDQAALLCAFAKLKTPGVTLEIVGEGPLEGALRAQAEALGITDRVCIRGAVAHDMLPTLYREADLHLLTSRHEAFGMVVIEAAACSVPTVGYARGVLPELAAAKAGIAVPPGDESALAAAIDSLLADRARLTQMKAAARRVVLERYTASKMCKGTRTLYTDLCSFRTWIDFQR